MPIEVSLPHNNFRIYPISSYLKKESCYHNCCYHNFPRTDVMIATNNFEYNSTPESMGADFLFYSHRGTMSSKSYQISLSQSLFQKIRQDMNLTMFWTDTLMALDLKLASIFHKTKVVIIHCSHFHISWMTCSKQNHRKSIWIVCPFHCMAYSSYWHLLVGVVSVLKQAFFEIIWSVIFTK